MGDYYDREGNQITFEQWVQIFSAADPFDLKTVDRSIVLDGIGERHYVSTVWLGMDHGFGDGPPLIFETMVFCEHEPVCAYDQWMRRYSTEDEAYRGHWEKVFEISPVNPPLVGWETHV